MLHLIAIIFLVVNGVEATEPTATLTNGSTFQSKAECEDFLGTETGAEAKVVLEQMVRSHFEGVEFVAKFACVEADGEDDSI